MKKYISWHLFGDNWDEWYNTRKESEEEYKQKVLDAEGSINIRLYKTISFEDDTLEVEEEYVKGRGNYPW